MPDADQPDPNNRKVDTRHAKGFGEYLKEKSEWVAPSLLARDNGGIFEGIPGTDDNLGYLDIRWSTVHSGH